VSWWTQAKTFFDEVKSSKSEDVTDKNIPKEDLEYVTSVSEARLLAAPEGASFLIMMVAFLSVILIVWSLAMQVDEIVKAEGKIIPSKQVQNIQSLYGGIIKEVKVIEGQNVKKDDILLIIDDVNAKSNLLENEQNYYDLLARKEAIEAGLAGHRNVTFSEELHDYPDYMRLARARFNATWEEYLSGAKELQFAVEQREKEYANAISDKKSQESNYKLAKEELKLNEPLLKSGAISSVELLHIKQKVNEAEAKYLEAKNNVPKAKSAMQEAIQKLEAFKAQKVSIIEKEHEEVKTKLESIKAKGSSLEAKVSYATIKSPVTGIIKKINFNTIGGVIKPGESILEIIPTDDRLLIEAKVKPKDIGFIHEGLNAKVKLTAFDFATYGGLDGKVVFVSADTITDQKGVSFFLVRVLTDKNTIKDKKGITHTIIPGMQTEVDVVVDQKSIMAYILKPMLK